MRERGTTARLVAVAVLGFVLVNPPLLTAADVSERVLGVPLLYAYLFGAWALLIALIALVLRRAGGR